MGAVKLKSREASLDEVLQIALARVYSPEIAQRILSTKSSHVAVEVSPQGEVRTYSTSVGIRFGLMPVGTLFISTAAWLRMGLDPVAGAWVGMGIVPSDWKLSLAFLFLAHDLKDPGRCQYYDLTRAKEYWKHHEA